MGTWLQKKKNYGVTLEVLNQNLHLVFGGGRGLTYIDLQIYYFTLLTPSILLLETSRPCYILMDCLYHIELKWHYAKFVSTKKVSKTVFRPHFQRICAKLNWLKGKG